MSPAARNIKLLYVSKYDNVDVFSYPGGKRVGTLTGFQSPSGLCVDKAGDVFVTNFGASDIVEYAHGGTKPIATLSDPYQEPDDCSVDPTTGNLAVANIGGSVSIYEGAKGHPKQRTDSEIAYMFFLSYDGHGDLFVDGENDHFDQFELAELPAGGKRFVKITLDQTIGFPGGVEWDGKHLAVGDQDDALIYRFTISGSSGTKIGTVRLEHADDVSQFWIHGSHVIGPNQGNGTVMFWDYPAGGEPTKTISRLREPSGATVSLAK